MKKLFSFQMTDIELLESISKEIAEYVMDNAIAILPADRVALIEAIGPAANLTKLSKSELDDVIDTLSEAHSRMAIAINLERYHSLDKCVTKSAKLIARYKQMQVGTSIASNDLHMLCVYLRHKGFIRHAADLEQGNFASVVSAYQHGYLSLPEVAEAIAAVVSCQNQLQLSHIADANRTMIFQEAR